MLDHFARNHFRNLGGGGGGGGHFFSICLFLPPSGEDINIFKMVVKKLTKSPILNRRSKV